MPSSLYGNKFDFVNRFGGPYSSSAYGRSASAEQSSHKTKWTPPIMTVTTYPPLFSWDKIPFIFLQLHPADATTAPRRTGGTALSCHCHEKQNLSSSKSVVRRSFVPFRIESQESDLFPPSIFLPFFLRGNRDWWRNLELFCSFLFLLFSSFIRYRGSLKAWGQEEQLHYRSKWVAILDIGGINLMTIPYQL